MRATSRGFTLIELMIAVAILAIVAAIALPLYNQYSMRTYRAEVQADLLACAQALERYAAINFNYAGSEAVYAAGDLCDPQSVQLNRYAIVVDAADDGSTFLITATPEDPGPMADDGIMTYDDAGNRGWDRDGDGAIEAGETAWED
jgi:type IV pilus assembly protein PilE